MEADVRLEMATIENLPRQQWIATGSDAGAAPQFRREFQLGAPVKSAVLRVCGLGYHEAWLNGERVGDHVLDPAQTDYDRRVLYVTHDVTALVSEGLNCLGVVLGNGWYNQDRVWGSKTKREDGTTECVSAMVYGRPRLMAELHVTSVGGGTEIIRADDTWRWASGPVTENNIYAGECYDARLEMAGWSEPGFDDVAWLPSVVVPSPGGELQEQLMPPMRRIEELPPLSVRREVDDRYVVDFGQNCSGWVKIRVEGPAGTEVAMRFAEAVDSDGNLDTASTGVFATTVEQVDRYVCKGGEPETWEPRFTYHGFRYVEVTGWPGELTADALTGVVVHTDLPVAGSFACSDERLNQLHRMAVWTHRSNIHGIPEDCPARERCGWLGDANLVAEYSMWNFSAKLFWEKFLGDIETTRAQNGGMPCDVAPGRRCTTWNANPDWAAAFIMLPWYLYLHYDDKDVVAKHWQGMTQLMEHFAETADNWILSGGYGDFFDPGTDAIVMHTPQTLSTTLWLYRCATVMTTMATVMKRNDLARQYDDWSRKIASAVTQRYFDHARGSFGSQGADVLALAFGALPEHDERILAALVDDICARGTHLNVGVMGVRYLFEVLTRRGQGSLALALMHQDSYPGFGHLIGRGATTLWECWGEEGHNATHGARSLSHPFMGGFDNWFFNTLAGIRPDPGNPGFKHVIVSPVLIDGLTWVRAHHDAPCGRIVSEWRRQGGLVLLNVTVPSNSTATVCIPAGAPRAIRVNGVSVAEAEGVALLCDENGESLFEAGSGEYQFELLD